MDISLKCRWNVAAAVVLMFGGHAFGQEATIAVVEPNGGEQWAVGSSHDVRWTSAGVAEDAKVEVKFSVDDGQS